MRAAGGGGANLNTQCVSIAEMEAKGHHVLSEKCWCKPTVEIVPGGKRTKHHDPKEDNK